MRHAEPDVADRPHARTPEAIGAAAFIALLLALTLSHPSTSRIHTWPWALFAGVYWLLPVVLAIPVLAAADRSGWPSRLVSAGLILLVAATTVSALVSPFPAASLPRIWPTLGGVATVLVLHRWLSQPGATETRTVLLSRIASSIAAAVLTVSLVGWWQGAWPMPWGTRNTVPFGHSIYTAGFTVLALPWLIWAAWRSPPVRRIAWSAVILIALIVLASTSSRGGALAFGVAAAAGALIVLIRAPWSGRRKTVAALAVIFMAGAVALANPRLRVLILERSWSDVARESNVQRSAMLAAGLKLGQQRPWFGWGPGTVPLAYPRVRAELDGGVENVLQLHNTPIQLWATLGMAGVLALAVLAAGVIRGAAVRLRAHTGAPESLAAAASLGGYALFTLTDHQFDVPVINAIAAASLAILTARAAVQPPTPLARANARLRPALLVGLASALALFAIPLLRDVRARQIYESAVTALEQGRRPEWLAALDRAAALAPADPYYQHQAAVACLEARDAEDDPARWLEHTGAAVRRLEASLATGAHQEFAHFNLGWLNLDLERPIVAAQHFIAAARLAPDKGGVYFGLGLALQAARDPEGAVRAFALEWVNDPLSMSSPAWEVPLLASLRPAVRAETLRLYARLANEHAAAETAGAWARWWLGERVERPALAQGFSAEARDFAAALRHIETGSGITGNASWATIYSAWREPDAPRGFVTAAGGNARLAAALQRRARRHHESFHAFLTAPAGDEPALVQTYRRKRTGYGVLALHPDGPVLVDAYTVQQNRVAVAFASRLLPAKGWLPGRFLLALLPPISTVQKPVI